LLARSLQVAEIVPTGHGDRAHPCPILAAENRMVIGETMGADIYARVRQLDLARSGRPRSSAADRGALTAAPPSVSFTYANR
jgi:hypothetical protein